MGKKCNSRHPLHGRWHSIRNRCRSDKNPDYHNYGGRGINVCSEWYDSFYLFRNYLMSLPHALDYGYSLDRIDNEGNYEPGNVRWATRREQNLNRRQFKYSSYKWDEVNERWIIKRENVKTGEIIYY